MSMVPRIRPFDRVQGLLRQQATEVTKHAHVRAAQRPHPCPLPREREACPLRLL